MESAQLFQLGESRLEVFIAIPNPSYRDLAGSIAIRWKRIDDDRILGGWLNSTTDRLIWIDNLPYDKSTDIYVKIGTPQDLFEEYVMSVNNWILSTSNIQGFIKTII